MGRQAPERKVGHNRKPPYEGKKKNKKKLFYTDAFVCDTNSNELYYVFPPLVLT